MNAIEDPSFRVHCTEVVLTRPVDAEQHVGLKKPDHPAGLVHAATTLLLPRVQDTPNLRPQLGRFVCTMLERLDHIFVVEAVGRKDNRFLGSINALHNRGTDGRISQENNFRAGSTL